VLDDAAFGAAPPVTPNFISPADPASRWTGANKGLAFFAYATNCLIDLDHAVIVDGTRPQVCCRPASKAADPGFGRRPQRRRARRQVGPARTAISRATSSGVL